MRRRDCVVWLFGSALTWPLAAMAEQSDRTRRIGFLVGLASTDPAVQPDIAALEKGLSDLGWRIGRNIKIEYRWGPVDGNQLRRQIRELVELQCDVIVSRATPITAALVREVKTIPIVFVNVSDPVGDLIVTSLARPGGNTTGFTNIESTMGGKWVQLLKEVSPKIAQVTMLYSPKTTPGGGSFFLRPFEASASRLRVRTFPAAADSDDEIEKALSATAGRKGGALIVAPGLFLVLRRELVDRKSVV